MILERCRDTAERQFYLERTKQFGWTKNVLIHQIENKTFEKTLLNEIGPPKLRFREHIRHEAKLAVKDEYIFDFLELADEHSERQLERAILAKIEPFLLEMGGMFSFVGSQLPLGMSVDRNISLTSHFSTDDCDLLVAVELKIGEFQPGAHR